MESLKKACGLLLEAQVATNDDLKEAVADRVKNIQDMCAQIKQLTDVAKGDPGVSDAVDLAEYLCSGINEVIEDASREYQVPMTASVKELG